MYHVSALKFLLAACKQY